MRSEAGSDPRGTDPGAVQVAERTVVSELGCRLHSCAQRGERQPAADRDPPYAERSQLGDRRAAGTGDDVDRSVHLRQKAAQVVGRGHARSEEHVGTCLLVTLQPGDRVGQVIPAVDVVLRPTREDKLHGAAVGDLRRRDALRGQTEPWPTRGPTGWASAAALRSGARRESARPSRLGWPWTKLSYPPGVGLIDAAATASPQSRRRRRSRDPPPASGRPGPWPCRVTPTPCSRSRSALVKVSSACGGRGGRAVGGDRRHHRDGGRRGREGQHGTGGGRRDGPASPPARSTSTSKHRERQ